jgi:lipid II:glycine glycyltransferase (peptidoglycan interpeptide bridge formation enzyme)
MDKTQWNSLISQLPEPHILQSWEWGYVKSKFGWSPIYKLWGDERRPDAAALVLERKISIGFFGLNIKIHYVPKGPLLRDWGDQDLVEMVLKDLERLAKKRGAIFIKIDPDVILGRGIPNTEGATVDPLGERIINYLIETGWDFSEDQIQYRNSVLIDLKPNEDEILARMKQKTRYNVRLARRRGVTICEGSRDDFDLFYKMYAETSIRDGFAIRDADYYHTLWSTFLESGEDGPNTGVRPYCKLLTAEVESEAVAGVVVFIFARKAYYLHGMSRPIHRDKMPNYLLQWEAILKGKEFGCSVYDLWGAPEHFNETDSMWGVYRFKEGLGGTVIRTIGAYDLPVRPIFYKLYTIVLPKILNLIRGRHFSRLESDLDLNGNRNVGLG